MSFFTQLGNALSYIGEKLDPKKDRMSPVAAAVYIEQVNSFIKEIRDAANQKTLDAPLRDLLVHDKFKSSDFRKDAQAYRDMVHQFAPLLRREYGDNPGDLIRAASSFLSTSLEELSDKVSKIIPHEGVNAGSPLKLSTVLTLGFVDQVVEFGCWAQFIMEHAAANASEDVVLIPKYTFAYVADNAVPIAKFLNATMVHRDSSIATKILKIKGTAGDVVVSEKDGLAAGYLDDNNVSDWEHSLADGVIRNPVAMLYTLKETYRLSRIDTLRHRTNWLKERMSLLAMRNMGVAPSSPEYKKNAAAIQYYADIVSSYDKKIAALS